LRLRITRERPCASILIIPQRKTNFVGALHEKVALARLQAPWAGYGGSPKREERGRE
jgi:hypothetical protein